MAQRDAVDRHVEEWLRELPDMDVRVEAVITRMQRVVSLLRQQVRESVAAAGLPVGEYLTLHAIRRGGPPYRATATSLATDLVVSAAAMTSRLDNLEGARLIRRVPDSTDRRRTWVEMTAEGHAAWQRAITAQAALEHRLLGVLGPAEQDALNGYLRRVLLGIEPAED